MSTTPTLTVPLYGLTSRNPLLNINGELEFSTRVPIVSQIRSDDTLYVTQPGDRLTVLAYNAYGDVRLWWILYDNNAPQLTGHPLDLPVGITLRIPSQAAVELEIIDVKGI